ncbi:MAG: tRNA threonylcarbamoyladenosine dehydratase [Clostridia bacterium]|nr:tRNA threonylcarbamoyladenosine dehydratase [Clostridia bacterium]
MEQFSRTERLLGTEAVERLADRHVAVFGIGGVGSFAAEALVRSGIGAIDLIDNDLVVLSNLNRQMFALHSTLGMLKVDAAEARLLDINPNCRIRKWPMFYLPETADEIDLSEYDYVLDCIDTVAAKLALAERAHALGVPIIAAMGAGNKLDPTQFEVSDISKTSVDPLARVMRQQLRKRGIYHLKVVYSREIPIDLSTDLTRNEVQPDSGETTEMKSGGRRSTPGSIAFVPSVAGLIMAGEVIRDLCRKEK